MSDWHLKIFSLSSTSKYLTFKTPCLSSTCRYLRCSPDVNRLMHQQNAIFSNISSMLRYFLPKKTPLFAMFGPGLESSTSGLVRKIIEEAGFQKAGMFPGKFDGRVLVFFLTFLQKFNQFTLLRSLFWEKIFFS